MRLTGLALVIIALALPARAQESALVLDGSNSMWGRIDGRPRIAIARDAAGSLARALPSGSRMGLLAYGHRRAGTARISERFDVQGERMTHRVVLNLGTLRPVGALAPGAPRGGNWTLWADEVPGMRAGERVATSGTQARQLRLVQGSYRIRFQAGEASGTAEVFVPAGEIVPARLDLNAAELSLVATRGSAAIAAQGWEIRRPGQPRAVATSGASRARLVLPAGDWVVRARVDGSWTETSLTLGQGQVVEMPIMVPW